jgi:hypothetical protein
MEEYIKWLENKIEVCLEDKDLKREHWAFCQALKKYRKVKLIQDKPPSKTENLKEFLEWIQIYKPHLNLNFTALAEEYLKDSWIER